MPNSSRMDICMYMSTCFSGGLSCESASAMFAIMMQTNVNVADGRVSWQRAKPQ